MIETINKIKMFSQMLGSQSLRILWSSRSLIVKKGKKKIARTNLVSVSLAKLKLTLNKTRVLEKPTTTQSSIPTWNFQLILPMMLKKHSRTVLADPQ